MREVKWDEKKNMMMRKIARKMWVKWNFITLPYIIPMHIHPIHPPAPPFAKIVSLARFLYEKKIVCEKELKFIIFCIILPLSRWANEIFIS